ncbi:hypothetical protein [Nonomuraea sp. NPDC003709]|uniref:hypothetical protein n=1 Tax=Nonomuraea sp. NPDC003709 TaxID=3154450 RepID=UPI0033B469F9
MRELFGSAVRCGYKGCQQPLYRTSEGTGLRNLNVEIAHIHARSENAARWDAGMTAEENRSFDNLILMCLPHHEEIDSSPDLFPADLLRHWKRRQIAEAESTAAAVVLTEEEVAEVSQMSFGLEELVEAVSPLMPFTARSRSRAQALDVAFREAKARRKRRLVIVPPSRREAVLDWMQERPAAPVVVPEGQLRVLVAPMGTGKSERAARWWQDGLDICADRDEVGIPLWLEARTLGGKGLAGAVTEALGGDPHRPLRVVLEDVTWLPVKDANRLLDEARDLVGIWERMRILATSRPGPIVTEDERVDMAPWPPAQGAELVDLIVTDGLRGVWTPEIDDLLTSPLLALALAARLATGRTAKVSPSRLLADLATTILERERPQDLEQSWDLLTRLAARAIATQAAVPVTALGAREPQLWALTDSGLAVADNDGLRFTLPVFEHHFGAEALRAGIIEVETAASGAAFPLWRYPLTQFLTEDPHGGDEVVARIARTNPGAASWLLDEVARSQLTPPSASPRPWETAPARPNETDPSVRAGRWLRDAVEALLAGFGDCGTQLSRHHDGLLVQWGTRIVEDPVYGAGLILAEANAKVAPDLVAHNIEIHSDIRRHGWNRWTSFSLPTGPLGRWYWARDRLRNALASLVRQQRLPVPDTSPLATEREWGLAQHIIRIFYRRTVPSRIPLDELTTAIEEMMVKVNGSVRSTWSSGTARLDSDDIRWMQARLSRHHDDLTSPRPAPDLSPSGTTRWRWRQYSPDLTRTIVTHVFQDALTGYHDLVTTNFPAFGSALGLFSSLPLRAEGNIIIDVQDPGDDDAIWYALKPDPASSPQTPRADFTFTQSPQPLRDHASAAAFRHRRSSFHRPASHLSELPTGNELAATDLAYHWLATDLQALGWWTGALPTRH